MDNKARSIDANRMIKLAKTIGRMLAVLIDKGIITKEEAEYILEPLKETTYEKQT